MKKRRAPFPVLAAACAILTAAAPPPDLSATTLYTATAHNCHPINLATWHHPARTVLQAAHTQVTKIELCDSHFPIFTATLPYALDGPNDAWFSRLLAELADANGFWSYALVDLSDDTVITATVQRASRTVTTSYEAFRAAK